MHFGAGAVPRAPFIHHQLDAMFAIDLAHGRPMFGDQRFHARGLAEQAVPVVSGEVDGLPSARGSAIIVERPAVHAAERALALFRELGEETPGPVKIAAVGSGADERELEAELRHPGRVTPVLDGILIGRELAAASPAFVSYAPEADAVGFAVPVGGAQIGERAQTRRCVAVLDPLIKVP